jgi:hypothetical protein
MVALMVVVGFAGTAAADDPLPFRGWADEVVTSFQSVPGSILVLVTATGGGEATYLGHFTREATVLIDPVHGTFEGTVVFTAANGEQLFADLEGRSISLTTQVGTYTFTGGTGRFSDASGTAGFEAVRSDAIHVALTFEGTIDF